MKRLVNPLILLFPSIVKSAVYASCLLGKKRSDKQRTVTDRRDSIGDGVKGTGRGFVYCVGKREAAGIIC